MEEGLLAARSFGWATQLAETAAGLVDLCGLMEGTGCGHLFDGPKRSNRRSHRLADRIDLRPTDRWRDRRTVTVRD